MGTIRRIKKQLANAPMRLAKTGVTFMGCPLVLVNPANPDVVEQFKKYFTALNKRARCVNLHDMYDVHFRLLADIEEGEYKLN